MSETGFVKSNSKQCPLINCKACQGTGKVQLGEEHWETLVALKSLGKATAGEIFNEMKRRDAANQGLGQTAINVRLERMRVQKLVERKKNGKTWQYTLA